MGSRVEHLIRSSVEMGLGAVAAFNRRRLTSSAPHPFLIGVHRPMEEELTLTELSVTGTIPPALDGRYLRIGPNPAKPDPAGYHWFIGDGMVHGLRLQGGRALWYRNRWIRSQAVADALGGAPAPGPRHGGFDTVNTNVVPIGGVPYALVEAGSYPVRLSETLDEQHYDPFGGTLAGSFTAHPHRDPLTGEQHAICYEATKPDEIRHVVIDAGGQVIRELAIPVDHGPMIHDCAITARYAVILDLSVTFSMKAMIGGHSFPYRWNRRHEARIGLLPRHGGAGDIVWCTMAPGFAFHVANAFDLPDGRVAIDVCAYETMFDDALPGPRQDARGLERWTADPATGRVTVERIDAAPQEFPRIDERLFGQRHRYIYSMALAESGEGAPPGVGVGLYRQDAQTGERQAHRFRAGCYGGEFVFVPKAPDSDEAAGWLVGLVIDQARETSELLILDAERFEAEPVARIHLPHRVPPGFHGNWIDA